MALVRGSVDRLKLEWTGSGAGASAVGPDGREYLIQSEQVRGEPRAYWFMPNGHETDGCPYGYTGTVTDARRTAEWVAWVRAGKPTS